MFGAGSAISTLGIDISPFTSGLLQSHAAMELFPGWLTALIADPVLGAIAIAKELGHAFVEMFESVAHAADTAGETAQKLGVSTSFLTGWQRAATDAGGSAEGFADALKFLNRNAAEAADGNKDTQANFADLGVEVVDTAGKIKGTEQLWDEVRAGIVGIEDPAKRTKAAMDLLGRGGADMLAALKAGDELNPIFERLGANIDENLARSGDKFGTLETIVGAAWDGIKNRLAAPILDAFAADFDGIVEKIISSVEQMTPDLMSLGQSIADFLPNALHLAEQLVPVLNSIVSAINSIVSAASKVLQIPGVSETLARGIMGTLDGPSGVAVGGGAGRSSNYNIEANIHLPGVEPKAAADHMASRIAPMLQRAMEQADDQQRAASERAATERGL